MSLGRFVVPLDLGSIRYHGGGMLLLLAAALLVPLAVVGLTGDLTRTAVLAGLAGTAGLAGWTARRRAVRELALREALVVTTLAYLVFALAGAVVFLGAAEPADAFFEAMSGFTTTGLSVLDPATLPPGLLFFRAYSQWVGGAGIVILSLVVLAGHGSAASHLYASEFGQDNLLGSVLAMARMVAVVYVAVTAAAYVALVAAGAGAFGGLLHAFTVVSTGGFSTMGDSIGGYASPSISAVTGVFMVIGATSLPLLYVVARQGRWRRLTNDVQVRVLLALLVVGTLVSVGFEGWRPGAVGQAAYHVTSALTTTGFTVGDPADLAPRTRALMTALMIVGGGAGSTAGGLKLLRLVVLAKLVHWTVLRTLMPREVQVPLQVSGVTIGEDELRRAFTLVVAYAAMGFVSSLALTGAGVAAPDAFFEVASALGTVGQSVGVTSPDLPAWAKLLLCVNMWAGRLEVLPLLVLLHPRNWQLTR